MGYSESRKRYAAVGVDTEKAIRALKGIPISLNSWQPDDLDLALRLIPGRRQLVRDRAGIRERRPAQAQLRDFTIFDCPKTALTL